MAPLPGRHCPCCCAITRPASHGGLASGNPSSTQIQRLRALVLSVLEATPLQITPGTGKTHLSIALAVQAARSHRVAFATAHQWVERLAAAQRAGCLDAELERQRRIRLLACDEVGYSPSRPRPPPCCLPWCPRATNAPARSSAQQAPLGVGQDLRRRLAVAAMVDRLVHHTEIVSLKGDSYRLKNRRKEVQTIS